jgi:restriction system protein
MKTTRKSGKTEFVKWMGPILEALKSMGGSAKPSEIAEWIGKKYNIPDKVLSERYEKSGVNKFQNQLAWGRQYLVWEDLLSASKRGVWTLTHKGWETTLSEEQSRELFLKWVRIFQSLKNEKKPESENKSGERNIELQVEKIIDSSEIKPQTTLLEILQNLSPKGFELLCGRLLREYDFENIEITQQSHDGGIDGYATLKLNPFVNISVYFQCKRYSGTVPTEKVQAFIGVMETNKRSVEKGLLITTGSFAKAAREIERSNIKLELIDGEQLVQIFENVELGLIPKVIYEPNLSFFEQYMDKEK